MSRTSEAPAARARQQGTVRRLAARSLLAAGAFLAAACGSDPASLHDAGILRTEHGLEYRAWTDVLESFPVQLRINVRITNTTGSAIDLTFPDGCVVLVRAYRQGASQPAWDQQSITGCTLALVQVRLEPGRSVTRVSATGARAILGDSLPDGHYLLQAVLRPNTGLITVQAGTVPLSVPR
jgi:hypothetical protein